MDGEADKVKAEERVTVTLEQAESEVIGLDVIVTDDEVDIDGDLDADVNAVYVSI